MLVGPVRLEVLPLLCPVALGEPKGAMPAGAQEVY